MVLLLLIAWLGFTDADNGALRIQSEPGTEVLWEGVSLEATDRQGLLTVSDIPPGQFAVVLRKQGFREYRTTVTIVAGETTVLKTRLQPAAVKRVPGAEQKPSPERAPAAAGRAQPKPSDQGNKLSRLLESEPKRGPVPVWPASSPVARVPEKGTEIPVWPFILGLSVLAVGLWFYTRGKRVALTAPSPALLDESDAPEPARAAERTASFLHDLKKREELLEQGVEIIPARTVKPVIDLDSASVREVEDQ